MANSRRGFTLIELLTVIAIIALLAAILFPVFQRINENRRVATCISNMHDLYVAANLYKDDNGGYPNVLLGIAERPDKLPWLQGDPGPVEMGQIQRGTLYPTYVKDIEKFHCPDNPMHNKVTVVTAVYPPSSPWSTFLAGGVPTFDKGGMTFIGLPASYAGQTVSLYAYDSYDLSSSLDINGKRIPGGTAPGYYIAYSRDWTGARARGLDPKQDAPNQLVYMRSMPADKTILTWCNYHVSVGGGDKCPVIFASGTAKNLDYKQIVTDGWNIGNR